MKILVYCQHVLGIGHLFRTVEIVRHMEEHQVLLVLGGPPIPLELPVHVQVVRLPGLRMDETFSGLLPVEPGLPLEQIQQKRRALLRQTAGEFQPDLILIELFPFGRNAFSFELIPLLESVRQGKTAAPLVICSLRDILVEKKDREKFEKRALDRLNRLFDGLLVHGDPSVITLDETFSRMDEIRVPVFYTGYISERSSPGTADALREKIHLQPDEKLVVVSAGGGNVGYSLLRCAVNAFEYLESSVRMQLFTGPYLGREYFSKLKELSAPGVHIERFADNFPEWLAAADLSVSMGGYNTTMNILAAGTPALILPFSQNREQRLRTAKLAEVANIMMLDEEQLSPATLAGNIATMIRRNKLVPPVRLDGAKKTGELLNRFMAQGQTS